MRAASPKAAIAAAFILLAAVTGSAAAAPPVPTAPPVSVGHSGWTWGSPRPQGQSLAAVTFQGATGYAVGDLGTVLRSDDGGATWTGEPSGTTDDLDLVQELDPDTVIVAGACSVRESTDGGESFSELPLGLGCTSTVAGVAFSDAEHGYVELDDGTLLYTDDGGATLEARSSPPIGGGSAAGIAFNSPTTGVAISSTGLIERTTDGGNSWTQVSSSPALSGVTFVTPSLAYAVGIDGELLSSADGGATWTQLPLAIAGGGGEPNLHEITCADADTCLISTTDSNELVRTTDGGMTGTLVSVSNSSLKGVAFSTATNVVGVGQSGATVLSADGGQTFPVVSSTGSTGFTADGPLRAGLQAGTAYLPGTQGQIEATVDGGDTWSLLRVPTNSDLSDVAFPTAQLGFALDRSGTLRRTEDGGVSWRSFAVRHSAASALAAPSRGVQLLVGPKGISRATDGGVEFHKVRGDVRVRHGRGHAVSSLSLDHAVVQGGRVVAWGDSGIVVSSDGGRTWRAVRAPVRPDGILSVSLAGAGRVWATSATDKAYSTSDGGRRWQRADSVGDLGRGDTISFTSAQDGVILLVAPPRRNAAFSQASVLVTRDGGRTWQPQVIAGGFGNRLVATPATDYLSAQPDAATPWLFATDDAGASPERTSLRISLPHRRLTAKALAHAHHSVLVTGRVTPVASAGEQVAVSTTDPDGRQNLSLVRVATNGAFRTHVTVRSGSLDVVAQVLGDGRHGGAGTAVVHFQVTGRKSVS